MKLMPPIRLNVLGSAGIFTAWLLFGCLHSTNKKNADPQFDGLKDQTIDEGKLLVVGISATSKTGKTVKITASNLPANAQFHYDTLSWVPGFDKAGSHVILFRAEVDGKFTDSEMKIQVNNVDPGTVPVFTDIPTKTVDEASFVEFAIQATVVGGGPAVVVPLRIPQNAFYDSATGLLSWFPTHLDSGRHFLRFQASDGGLTSIGEVQIDVNNVPVSYKTTIQDIWNGQCWECHSKGNGGYTMTGGDLDNGLELTEALSFESVVDKLSFQLPRVSPKYRIKPYDIQESYLIEKIVSREPKFGEFMPYGGFGGYVEYYNVQALKAWILEGAPNTD